MNVDTLVFRVAGIMVTAGVVLAYTHHIAWLALPLFAGLNMFRASFTGFAHSRASRNVSEWSAEMRSERMRLRER